MNNFNLNVDITFKVKYLHSFYKIKSKKLYSNMNAMSFNPMTFIKFRWFPIIEIFMNPIKGIFLIGKKIQFSIMFNLGKRHEIRL